MVTETRELPEREIEEVSIPLFLKGKWIRFKEDFPIGKRKYCKTAPCSIIPGIRGSGKSSLAENIATHFSDPLKHPTKTGKILDWFGSKDNEGLAWLRSPFKESVLLVTGDSVDLSCSYDWKRISQVTLSDFRNYHVIIAVASFFSKIAEEHQFIKSSMNLLWRRQYWNYPWNLLIREAANLIYSRITIGQNQAQAKAYFIYVMRESRHAGYAVTADAIRFKAVDIDLRQVVDYTFLKAQGESLLPREKSYLYKYFTMYSVMKIPPQRFILVTKKGSIARGYFEYPPWHKTEKEHMLKIFDIVPKYGEMIDYGEGGGNKRVSDFEHEKLVTLRVKEEGSIPLSHHKIAKQLKRSSYTVWKEINQHNKAVRNLGVCSRCKRVRCSLQSVEV